MPPTQACPARACAGERRAVTRYNWTMPQLPGTEVRDATIVHLDTETLYALLRLRVDVFVVEQRCPYPDLDGRDLEPSTRHVWLQDRDGRPLSYLRILDDGDVWRIGRVATVASARGRGLAERLLARALALTGDRPVVLDAQAPLERWYARFGFTRAGDDFVEDGIPHVPMRLTPLGD